MSIHNSVEPIFGRILIQEIKLPDTVTAGGIILPEKQRSCFGKIVAVGDSVDDKFKVGQTVFYGAYAGIVVKPNPKDRREEFRIIQDDDVLCIYHDEGAN